MFSIARIRVRALDSAGKPVRAEWQIFRKDAPEEPVVRFSGADWTEKALSPGEYTLKAHHKDTKVTLTADAAPGNGETAAVELVFAQGKLLISGLDSNGKPVYTDSYVYKAPFDRDNPDEAARDGGNKHEYSLVPGTYDILVRDHNTKVEQWIRDVVIEGGKIVRKEVSFAQGKLLISGLDSNGKPVYRLLRLQSPFDRDNPDEAARDGGNKHEYSLVPGTYDILVRDHNTKVEQWIRDVVIEGGKPSGRKSPLPRGRLLISGLDSNGKPVYTDSYVYKAPFDRDNPDEAARTAATNMSIPLSPGPTTFSSGTTTRRSSSGSGTWSSKLREDRPEGSLPFAQGKLLISGPTPTASRSTQTPTFTKPPSTGTIPTRRHGTAATNMSIPLSPGPTTFSSGTTTRRSSSGSGTWSSKEGKTVRKEVSFAQGKLLISGLDSNGKPVYTDSYVYKAPSTGTTPTRRHGTAATNMSTPLSPGPTTFSSGTTTRRSSSGSGTWSSKEGRPSGRKSSPPGNGPADGEAGFEGKPVYFFTEIFLSPAEENDEFVHSDSGENEVSFPIVPGTYDVKVWTEEPRAELWEKGMEVKAGATAAKSFAFPAARVRITPPKKGTEWTYIFVDVFPHPAGEDDEAAVSEAGAEEHIQFFLVPGTYDFRIRDEEERETWMRGIELAADEKFAGEVKFED